MRFSRKWLFGGRRPWALLISGVFVAGVSARTRNKPETRSRMSKPGAGQTFSIEVAVRKMECSPSATP